MKEENETFSYSMKSKLHLSFLKRITNSFLIVKNFLEISENKTMD